MHVIQVIRNYLNLTQQELAQRAGLSQPDLCDMEIKEPYGRIDKYQRLADYLGISIHALVTDDCSLIPLSFFEKHSHPPYEESCSGATLELGRRGEDAAFALEKERLQKVNPSLAKLVQPHYKMRSRPGYDILSFDESGKPVYIEVKTSQDATSEFTLTRQEYQRANKALAEGEKYLIFRYTNWGTPNQTLVIHDYAEMKAYSEFFPATYMCSMNKREPLISGITYHREARGITKGELADYLGINTAMLWNYENGHRQCPVDTYKKMANVLDVTIDDLVKNYPVKEKNESV